jgi:O-antigen biosynthesis protein
MVADRTIFDEPHYQSLEFLAARSLADGDPVPAFKFADRRCRILPVPEPHCYVLRAEAYFQMGSAANAVADIAKALEINPYDLAANRRMLEWTRGHQQIKAALTLIEHEHEIVILRHAIQILHEHGYRNLVGATVLDDAIEGWALWEKESHLSISITDGVQSVETTFEPDVFHPLSEFGRAVSFSFRRPKSPKIQSILFATGGSVLHTIKAASNAAAAKPRLRPHRTQTLTARKPPVTVIVPIYGDYDATKLCLEALRIGLKSSGHRAILINDATPDHRITKYLAKFKTEGVEILVNAHNLGFIGSVNRALEHIDQGDVIFLNADTLVPPGFINRLAAIAESSPDIGTLTPLSNNGEFVSFPTPNTFNRLLSCKDTIRIDQIASKINAKRIVDIPSGIGFCLYVTRACLDAVGSLSEAFGQGYLEDTEFCLRARNHGFRNVCATSVYVGHAGSKSFRENKRSLVVRNLKLLEWQFPDHRAECAAFMVSDPLRAAREAIERAAAVITLHPILLVTGAGAVGAIARKRASEIASAKQPVLILEIRHRTKGPTVKIEHASGEIPQSSE